MKFNPYSLVLIMVFIITVAITNNTLKKTKQKYEKTNYDSCVYQKSIDTLILFNYHYQKQDI
jgi:hypothetical protein